MAIIEKSVRVLALRLRDRSKVIGSFPKVQIIDGGPTYGIDDVLVGVPHRNDSIAILRNLGLKTEGMAPIRHYYPYPKIRGQHDPMPHQRITSEFVSTHNKCFVLNVQRTGKTGSVIWAVDFMKREHDVKGVLVVSTMSCIRTVWENEIFGTTPNRSVAVIHGDRDRRKKLLKLDYDYFVINHDGIKIVGKQIKQMIAEGRINLIVVDEGAEFNDAGTEKYAVLKELCDLCPRVWWMTGTPMSKGPDAVWAQVKIINPSRVPEFITHWKHLTMIKINKYKWIPRHDAKEKVFAAMQPAIRFEKSDVLKSLPPMTHSNIEAGLSKQQTDMIKELKKEGALLLNNSTITVPNAAVMLSKVLQICAGAVKLDDGTSLPVDCGPRLAEMDRLIDGTSAKVIVLANWHAVVDLLVAHIGQKHGVVWIDGRVTGRARDEAIRKFQQDPSVKVLAAHPKTISHGLELSVADTQIWFGPTYSPEQMAQANERMASALQKNPMGIYYLASSRIEWRVFANVRGGLNLQASTMDLFREFVKESISEEA